MGKYFGTDGIRGIAGSELSCDLSFKAGLAAAYEIGKELGRKPLFVVGRDTRISGDMILASLTAGLTAGGADVIDLGILPTPAVAYITANTDFVDSGIIISASHNPYEHNGIKFVGAKGFKLTDEQEAVIESYIDNISTVPQKTGSEVGVCKLWQGDSVTEYVHHIVSNGENLSGMRLLIDCANGAAYKTAKEIFKSLGAEAEFIACQPDGVNINDGCGSTHLDKLSALVKEGNYDAGIAFDGDADRFLMVDEHGAEVDGDKIIASVANYMKQEGTLRGGAVVSLMSNLAFHEYLHQKGISTRTTAVGDRYVLEDMVASGYNIGGEQSGHIILTDYCTTGDGQMTAVQVLSMLKKQSLKASYITNLFQPFPQVIINVPVKNEIKKTVGTSPEVEAIKKEISAIFGESGRIVIRPSGTEAKVRIMVEGKDAQIVHTMAQKAADTIKELASKA